MSKGVEKTLHLFTKKCENLDVPPESCPDVQFLQKILRQRLSFFESFIARVDTKQNVERIKRNILLSHLKETKNSKIRIIDNYFPKDYSKYIKYNQLHEKIDCLEEKLSELKKQELAKLEEIKNNDATKFKLKEHLRLDKSKLHVLQAKYLSMNEEYEQEVAFESKTMNVTPAKFSSSDKIEEHSRRIQESIELLKKFSSESAEVDNKSSVKEKYLKAIAANLQSVPNIIIFQLIMKQLSTKIDDSFISTQLTTKTQSVDHISQQLLPSLYQHKIIRGIELIAQRKKLNILKSLCAEKIQNLENEMDGLLSTSMDYSLQLECDDIISDFAAALVAKLSVEGKIQFCRNIISSLKQQVDNDTVLMEYEKQINDTRIIHGAIDEKISEVQENVAQVHQINEKINFTKISFMRLIQALKMEKSQQHNRALMNQTINNSVMMTSMRIVEANFPKHEAELQEFLAVPIYNFDKGIDANKMLLLNENHIISLLIVAAGHFIYPDQFIQLMKKRFNFATELKNAATETESSIDHLPDLFIDALERKRDLNSEEISLMLENITKNNVSIKNLLRNLELYYKYSLENPLKKYVPKSKKFDGKSYHDIEKEYMLYYKMIKN